MRAATVPVFKRNRAARERIPAHTRTSSALSFLDAEFTAQPIQRSIAQRITARYVWPRSEITADHNIMNSENEGCDRSVMDTLCVVASRLEMKYLNVVYVGHLFNYTSVTTQTRLHVTEHESRNDHRNALIIQDVGSYWMHSYLRSAKKDSTETTSCLQPFMPQSQNLGESGSLERVEELKMDTHHTNTLHRSKKPWIFSESVATAMVQRSLPEEWWDCSMKMLLTLAKSAPS